LRLLLLLLLLLRLLLHSGVRVRAREYSRADAIFDRRRGFSLTSAAGCALDRRIERQVRRGLRIAQRGKPQAKATRNDCRPA